MLEVLLIILGLAAVVGLVLFLKKRKDPKENKDAKERASRDSIANAIVGTIPAGHDLEVGTPSNRISSVLLDLPTEVILQPPARTAPVKPDPPKFVEEVDPMRSAMEAFKKIRDAAINNAEFQLLLDSSSPKYEVTDLPKEMTGGTRITVPIRGMLPGDEGEMEFRAYVRNSKNAFPSSPKRGNYAGVFIGKVANNVISFTADSMEIRDMSFIELQLVNTTTMCKADRVITVEK